MLPRGKSSVALMRACLAPLAFSLLMSCGARTGIDAGDLAGAAAAGGSQDDGDDSGSRCGDTRLIYLVSCASVLKVFNPDTGVASPCRTLDCTSTTFTFGPSSMAISREGIAYVNYSNDRLIGAGILDASCEQTPVHSSIVGFQVAFVPDVGTATQTLYIGGVPEGPLDDSMNPYWLAWIDMDTFEVHRIAALADPVSPLTTLAGTPEGRLFATTNNALFELDRSNGEVLGTPVALPLPSNSWPEAVIFWRGDFYFFNMVQGIFNPADYSSTILRYRPGDGSFTTVATFSDIICGAGAINFGD